MIEMIEIATDRVAFDKQLAEKAFEAYTGVSVEKAERICDEFGIWFAEEFGEVYERCFGVPYDGD